MNTQDQQIVIDRSMTVPESGCWLWMNSENGCGYGDFRLNGKHHLAHRFSFTAFNGEIPAGMHVLHKCDTRLCVNPDHLFSGTNADNIEDSMNKGRRKGITRNRPSGLSYKPQREGANAARTKIPRHLVPMIALRRKNGESRKSIAKEFNVDPSLISHLIRAHG